MLPESDSQFPRLTILLEIRAFFPNPSRGAGFFANCRRKFSRNAIKYSGLNA